MARTTFTHLELRREGRVEGLIPLCDEAADQQVAALSGETGMSVGDLWEALHTPAAITSPAGYAVRLVWRPGVH